MAVAYYYIDNTNGLDAHTGLRIPAGDITSTSYNTVDSTADTTHFVDAALTGANDYLNGSFFWNVTRGAGSLITDFVAADDTVTLGAAVVGMTAGDEYYILDSWQTLAQYTTTSARTAGDKAYVRANQTHTIAAVIAHDEDGTITAPISVIGCNATQGIDPYHDASDTRPIIDFNNGAYYLSIYGDDFWYYKNMDFKRTNLTAIGEININYSFGFVMENCIVRDSASSTGFGVQIYSSLTQTSKIKGIKFIDCQFTNNDYAAVKIGIATTAYEPWWETTSVYDVSFIRCSFDSGAEGTDFGVLAYDGCNLYFEDCTFGQSSAIGSNDIYLSGTSFKRVIARNCIHDKTSIINNAFGSWFLEDDQGVIGQASHYLNYASTVTKDTGVVRDGGATSSALIIPITIPYGTGLNGDTFIPDFRVWLTAGAHTVTVYIRGANWAAYPTASQLYLDAEYYTNDAAAAITRAHVKSTEVLTDNTTWVGLSCAVSPHMDSFVNLKLYLNLYEDATTGVYVDIKPVIS